jgi:hypothetical protein
MPEDISRNNSRTTNAKNSYMDANEYACKVKPVVGGTDHRKLLNNIEMPPILPLKIAVTGRKRPLNLLLRKKQQNPEQFLNLTLKAPRL